MLGASAMVLAAIAPSLVVAAEPETKVAPPPPSGPARVVPSPAPSTFMPTDRVLRVGAINGGQAIYMVGSLRKGSFKKLKQVFDANPKAKTLVINSPGGLVFEGAVIGEFVRKRAMNVYVEHFCMSACTSILASGVERMIVPGARIGFHQPYRISPFAPETDDTVEQSAAHASMRLAYVRSGVDAKFIEKSLGTASSTMWYPKSAELMAARFITATGHQPNLVLPTSFGMSHAQILAKVNEEDFWPKAKLANSDLHQEAIDRLWMASFLDNSKTTSSREGMRMLWSQLSTDMPRMPDELMSSLSQTLATTFAEMAKEKKNDCYSPLSPPGLSSYGKHLYSKEAQALLLRFLSVRPTAPAMSGEVGAEVAVGFIISATASGQIDGFDDLNFINGNCAMQAGLFDQIVAMPIAERGQTMRALFVYSQYMAGKSAARRR